MIGLGVAERYLIRELAQAFLATVKTLFQQRRKQIETAKSLTEELKRIDR